MCNTILLMKNLKRQVVVIGGGETFDTYEDYLRFLELDLKFNPETQRKPNWKENLQKDLGRRYEVVHLSMPSKLNAKYLEWNIYFRKVLPHLRDGVIFVGHSLGGQFLLKYLSENINIKAEIGGLLLVASPCSVGKMPGFADFNCDTGNEVCVEEEKVHIFHSVDDTIVPIETGAMRLTDTTETGSHRHRFTDRGHFIFDKHFPELVRVIRSL